MGVWDMKRRLIHLRFGLPRFCRPLFCLLLVSLLLTGCGTKSDAPDEQELNAALAMAPLTMDAQLAIDAGSLEYLNPMCGKLFRIDQQKGYVPELAESFEISEAAKAKLVGLVRERAPKAEVVVRD